MWKVKFLCYWMNLAAEPIQERNSGGFLHKLIFTLYENSVFSPPYIVSLHIGRERKKYLLKFWFVLTTVSDWQCKNTRVKMLLTAAEILLSLPVEFLSIYFSTQKQKIRLGKPGSWAFGSNVFKPWNYLCEKLFAHRFKVQISSVCLFLQRCSALFFQWFLCAVLVFRGIKIMFTTGREGWSGLAEREGRLPDFLYLLS